MTAFWVTAALGMAALFAGLRWDDGFFERRGRGWRFVFVRLQDDGFLGRLRLNFYCVFEDWNLGKVEADAGYGWRDRTVGGGVSGDARE
jgi:hypothetical protein